MKMPVPSTATITIRKSTEARTTFNQENKMNVSLLPTVNTKPSSHKMFTFVSILHQCHVSTDFRNAAPCSVKYEYFSAASFSEPFAEAGKPTVPLGLPTRWLHFARMPPARFRHACRNKSRNKKSGMKKFTPTTPTARPQSDSEALMRYLPHKESLVICFNLAVPKALRAYVKTPTTPTAKTVMRADAMCAEAPPTYKIAKRLVHSTTKPTRPPRNTIFGAASPCPAGSARVTPQQVPAMITLKNTGIRGAIHTANSTVSAFEQALAILAAKASLSDRCADGPQSASYTRARSW
mmetsp:Transcript_56780/g.164729  ORF Transcript_56780/g.164729 Transcript_56780/m.164729 type:complete len:294 (+) Transcript_56780:1134-2015(+)